jgi:hypothetical protein
MLMDDAFSFTKRPKVQLHSQWVDELPEAIRLVVVRCLERTEQCSLAAASKSWSNSFKNGIAFRADPVLCVHSQMSSEYYKHALRFATTLNIVEYIDLQWLIGALTTKGVLTACSVECIQLKGNIKEFMGLIACFPSLKELHVEFCYGDYSYEWVVNSSPTWRVLANMGVDVTMSLLADNMNDEFQRYTSQDFLYTIQRNRLCAAMTKMHLALDNYDEENPDEILPFLRKCTSIEHLRLGSYTRHSLPSYPWYNSIQTHPCLKTLEIAGHLLPRSIPEDTCPVQCIVSVTISTRSFRRLGAQLRTINRLFPSIDRLTLSLWRAVGNACRLFQRISRRAADHQVPIAHSNLVKYCRRASYQLGEFPNLQTLQLGHWNEFPYVRALVPRKLHRLVISDMGTLYEQDICVFPPVFGGERTIEELVVLDDNVLRRIGRLPTSRVTWVRLCEDLYEKYSTCLTPPILLLPSRSHTGGYYPDYKTGGMLLKEFTKEQVTVCTEAPDWYRGLDCFPSILPCIVPTHTDVAVSSTRVESISVACFTVLSTLRADTTPGVYQDVDTDKEDEPSDVENDDDLGFEEEED